MEEKAKLTKKKKSKAQKIFEWVFTGFFAVLFIVFGISQITGMIDAKNNHNKVLHFGYGSFVILTESMEPEYKTKSAIITYKESAKTIYDRFMSLKEKHENILDVKVDITFFHEDPRRTADLSDLVIEDPELVEEIRPTGLFITHRIREAHFREDVEFGHGRYIFIVAGINKGAKFYDEGQYQIVTESQLIGTVKVNSVFLGAIFSFLATPWGLLIFLLIPAAYLIITSSIDIIKALKENEKVEISNNAAALNGNRLDSLSEEEKNKLKSDLINELLNKGKDNESK